MKNFKNLIGGEWVEAGDGATFLNENPANHEDVIGAFASATKEDTRAAIEAARAALPAWANMPPPSRSAILDKASRILEARQHEYAAILTASKTRSRPWAK